MKFSYNWIKTLVPLKESPAQIAELLNLHAFEVETVQKIGNDFLLDAKIPTNRISDAGNHLGLAKEISALLKRNIKNQPSRIFVAQSRAKTPKIRIEKPALCPRYTAVVLNLKENGASPDWMQERLTTCGFRPINAIIDITNYIMLETGQPLHAFDLDNIHGGRMTIRESREGEKLTTLDETIHALPRGAIVIEDAERLIDLAGIMGGENSAVSASTKRILLQAAAFDPVRIYRATRALNFSSDAAKIYSAGTDPNKTAEALQRAVDLLREIDVIAAPQGYIDLYPKKTLPKKIVFRPAYADKIIGRPLGPRFHQEVFMRLGFKIKKRAGNTSWIIEVPTERRDLHEEEDLIEEIARLYGYEMLPSKLPESHLVPAPKNDAAWWERRIADHLVRAGFTESHLYEFAGDRMLDQFNIDRARVISLENPMNPETTYLSPRVLLPCIISVTDNLKHFDAIRIFSIAKSFRKDPLEERRGIAICIAQKGASGEEEFYLLKGAVEQMLESLGISDHWYDDALESRIKNQKSGTYHPYRMAEIKVGDEKIGVIGEIHPAILKNIKARARITAVEIDMEKLVALATTEAEYQPIGKYPAIIRDIAVVVPEKTKTEEILNVIENTGGELLADTDLFDYFQDGALAENAQKSMAFHLVFQSPDRTLIDAEIDTIIKKIIT
ncbi:MAG: phenylalanine--tRNA ligase subunit beta, partial [Candidatus Sungiibacteriota bacterium]